MTSFESLRLRSVSERIEVGGDPEFAEDRKALAGAIMRLAQILDTIEAAERGEVCRKDVDEAMGRMTGKGKKK